MASSSNCPPSQVAPAGRPAGQRHLRCCPPCSTHEGHPGATPSAGRLGHHGRCGGRVVRCGASHELGHCAVASHALARAVDEPTTIAELPAPEVHVVRGEQRVQDIREEELQEVLAEEVHLPPEAHPDESCNDDQAHVVRRERLHLMHLPHQPELREQSHGLLVHAVGDQDLHSEPVIAGVEEECEDEAGWRCRIHAQERRGVLRCRCVVPPALEGQTARDGRRHYQLEVGELCLHEPGLHGPDASGHDGEQVRDLGVDAEAIDRLMLPDLVHQQARRPELHKVANEEEEHLHDGTARAAKVRKLGGKGALLSRGPP
mmetsp:Transcript_60418/g.155731  ORF Transcript_60418/g.155731 Transcript_60418/m.155731 type:complete len:317 (-) Transcript_60418:36-986(-)